MEARLTSEPATTRPGRDLLDDLWRISSAPAGTVILALLLGLTLALAAVFPQEPAELQSAAEQHWLDTVAGTFGSLGPVLRLAGIFSILGGPWLRFLLAVIAYHLLLCGAAQAHSLWRSWQRPAMVPPLPGHLPVRRLSLDGPLDAAMARVADALRPRYPRTAGDDTGEQARLVYAERRRWAAPGPLLATLGALLILVALLLNNLGGWQARDLVLVPGSSVSPPAEPDIHIALGQTGASASSAISVTLSGGATRGGSLGFGHPYHWGDLWIVQQDTGPTLAVSAWDSGGRPVPLQSQVSQEKAGKPAESLHLPFPPSETEQAFVAPTRNLAFRVVSYQALPEQGYTGPVFLVEAYRGDNPATPIQTRLVPEKAALVIEGATYFMRREQHVVLDAASVPGMPPFLAGIVLALAGIPLALWGGWARAWIGLQARPETVDAVMSATSTTSGRAELDWLAQAVAATAGAPAPAAGGSADSGGAENSGAEDGDAG